MFQGRVCRYKDMHCLLFLLLLLLSSPSASSSICPFYLAPPRVSIRLAFVSRYRFSISLGATPRQPYIRSAVQTVFTYLSFVTCLSCLTCPEFSYLLPLLLLSFLPSSSPLLPPCPHLIPFSSLFPPLFCCVVRLKV